MSYRVAANVKPTQEFTRMTPDEQLQEQAAAYEIVTKNHGTIEAQHVLWADQIVLVIASYPDQESCMKAEMEITSRRSFEIQSQPCLTMEEFARLQTEVREGSVVTV